MRLFEKNFVMGRSFRLPSKNVRKKSAANDSRFVWRGGKEKKALKKITSGKKSAEKGGRGK